MQVTIKQVYRVEKFITVEVQEKDVEDYLNGDYETPCSSNEGWNEVYDLMSEEVEFIYCY